MRQRTASRLPDRATISGTDQTGSNELGEPIVEEATIAEDVPCAYSDESTQFVRTDSGERVNKPATVRFEQTVGVEEGHTIDIEGIEQTFEARGVDRKRDHRRGRIVAVVVELERVN